MASVHCRTPRPPSSSSGRGDVVPGEGAEHARPLRRSDEPAVVALFHHVDDVALGQLDLVLVLRRVVVEGAVGLRVVGDGGGSVAGGGGGFDPEGGLVDPLSGLEIRSECSWVIIVRVIGERRLTL